jgi:hypothetical protein
MAPTDSALTDSALTDSVLTDSAPADSIPPTAPVDKPVNGDIQMPDDKSEDRAPLAAMPDRPVYPRSVYPWHVYPQDLYPQPVIEVTVPGLDGPRALEREAMMKKLSEFRQRGLVVAEQAE